MVMHHRFRRSLLDLALTPRALSLSAVGLAAIVRLVNLDAFPTFMDEATHSWWAARLAESPSSVTLWLPITEDVKTPLFMWAAALAQRGLADAVLAGRLVAALAGVVTVALVYRAGKVIVGAWPAAIAAVLVAVSPALVFHGRMALTDGPIVMWAAVTWALSVRATRGHKLAALGAGVAVALAFWTKFSGALLLVIPISGIALAGRGTSWRRFASLVLSVTPMGASYLAFLAVPKSDQALERLSGFVLTPSQIASFPIDKWGANLGLMGGWALAYLPGVSIAAAVATIVLPVLTRRREDWWMWTVLVFTLAFHVVFGATLYSRYVLPALVPLSLLMARMMLEAGRMLCRARHSGVAAAWSVGVPSAVALSLAVPTMWLVVAPASAALPSDDRAQYVEAWSSGYGQDQAVQWIAAASAAEPGPAIVLTNHFLSAPRDLVALELSHRTDLALHVENRIRHPAGGVADDWRRHGVPVYALLNGDQDDVRAFMRHNPEFVQVAAFERPGGKTVVTVLEFRPG